VIDAARLATTRALSGLSAASLDALADLAEPAVVDAGATVATEGRTADWFAVVEHGRLAVELFVPGRGPLVVATIGPGHLVGWSWRFPPHVWHFDVVAVDRTQLWRFDAAAVRAAAAAHPELDRELTAVVATTMARRLEATRLQLADLYGRPT